MPYEVSYNEKNKIVLMQAFGMVTHDEHCAARRQAAQLCRENKCTRIVADLRKLDTEKSSTQDCFDFGKSIVKENVPLSTRMAVVLPIDLDSIKDVQFSATVAANRGRPIVQFKTMKEAKKWLLED